MDAKRAQVAGRVRILLPGGRRGVARVGAGMWLGLEKAERGEGGA